MKCACAPTLFSLPLRLSEAKVTFNRVVGIITVLVHGAACILAARELKRSW